METGQIEVDTVKQLFMGDRRLGMDTKVSGFLSIIVGSSILPTILTDHDISGYGG